MGKKKGLALAYASVAVLDGISKTQFIGQTYVQRAKAKFSHLNDPRLAEATEDWEVADVLRTMHSEYNCSAHPEDAVVALQLKKFI